MEEVLTLAKVSKISTQLPVNIGVLIQNDNL